MKHDCFEWIKTACAVLGPVLGIAALLWQYWTYRDNRRERAIVRTMVGSHIKIPSPYLCVEVINSGRVPIYIKEVTINYGDEKLAIGNELIEIQIPPFPPVKGPLEVGNERRFILARMPNFIPLLKQACQQPEENIWLSIKSTLREVTRVKGKEIKPLLQGLIDEK